jgi:polyhydroxyalkanoate synthesis regulator phasin
MIKGKLLTALAIVGVLAIPLTVFAAAPDSTAVKAVKGFFGIDASKLTAQQKSDAADYSKRIADLQKEFIDKMVQNGSMTKENGDAARQGIDEAYKASQESGGIYGITPGRMAGRGFGGKEGPGKGFADASKLTDQQKADINATLKKIDELSKGFIDTAVNDGLITKAQGDTLKSRLDGNSGTDADRPFGIAGRAGPPGMGFFGIFESDSSKLTDQQKEDIDNYSKNLTALRKELVGKYVSAGVITQEQGDAMLKGMEQKADPKSGDGPGKGMKMRGKGFFKNHTGSGGSGAPADTPAAGS